MTRSHLARPLAAAATLTLLAGPAFAGPPDAPADAPAVAPPVAPPSAPPPPVVLAAPPQVAPAPAPAGDTRPVVVAVDPAAAPTAPPDDVRAAIARELRAPAVAPGTTAVAARGTLTIALDHEHRLVIVYRDAAGQQVLRTVVVPSDPTAVVATIALLAGNLARNEVDELVGVRPPQAVVVAPPPGAVPVPPQAVVVVAPPPPQAVVVAQRPARAAQHTDWRAERESRRLFLGLEAYFALAPHGNDGVTPLFPSGLIVGYQVLPFLRVGLTDLNFSALSELGGTRWAIEGAPYVELNALLSPWLQPFAQLGVPVQTRFGAGLPQAVGAAPFLGAGVRLRIGKIFSVGIGARAYAVLTDGYQFTQAVLPQGAVVMSGGLEAGWHF